MSEPASRPHPEPPPSLLYEPPPSPLYEPSPSPLYVPSRAPAGPAAGGYYGTGPAQADRNWAVAAHLSGFVAAWLALGFIGPLVVLLTEGGRRPFARRHAVEALNFNLSVLLWSVISAVLALVLVGFLMLIALGILYLVATVLGAVAASRGADYRYPLTIRFVS